MACHIFHAPEKLSTIALTRGEFFKAQVSVRRERLKFQIDVDQA